MGLNADYVAQDVPMAIQLTRIEDHIYLLVLSGSTTIDEIASLGSEITRLNDEHGEDYYIEVVDMSELHTIPFDLRGLRSSLAKTSVPSAALLVHPPYPATMAAKILGKVTNLITEWYDTREAAIERARVLIAEKEGVKSKDPR